MISPYTIAGAGASFAAFHRRLFFGL